MFLLNTVGTDCFFVVNVARLLSSLATQSKNRLNFANSRPNAAGAMFYVKSANYPEFTVDTGQARLLEGSEYCWKGFGRQNPQSTAAHTRDVERWRVFYLSNACENYLFS